MSFSDYVKHVSDPSRYISDAYYSIALTCTGPNNVKLQAAENNILGSSVTQRIQELLEKASDTFFSMKCDISTPLQSAYERVKHKSFHISTESAFQQLTQTIGKGIAYPLLGIVGGSSLFCLTKTIRLLCDKKYKEAIPYAACGAVSLLFTRLIAQQIFD